MRNPTYPTPLASSHQVVSASLEGTFLPPPPDADLHHPFENNNQVNSQIPVKNQTNNADHAYLVISTFHIPSAHPPHFSNPSSPASSAFHRSTTSSPASSNSQPCHYIKNSNIKMSYPLLVILAEHFSINI